MKYLSLFSGIEAVSAAAKKLNWQPAAFSEIADFPCAVLKHHYPDVPNLGDVRNINGKNYYGTVDFIAGGSPCQDFSIAGKRAGLHGNRSSLAWEFVRILSEVQPKWFLWENVPGALSTNGGRDFSALLREMENIGYGMAWRILDAQYFGVPQRRRRIFLVGYFGDWRPSAAVLFESQSMQGNSSKGGRKKCKNSGNTGTGVKKTVFINSTYSNWKHDNICAVLRQKGNLGSGGTENIVIEPGLLLAMPGNISPINTIYDVMHSRSVRTYDNSCSTLLSRITGENQIPVTFSAKSFANIQASSIGSTLKATGGMQDGGSENYVIQNLFVRKLTPLECERLQGLPDNYTDIPYKGKPNSPLSKRYEAIGNSIAVPVLEWIFKRMEKVTNKEML